MLRPNTENKITKKNKYPPPQKKIHQRNPALHYRRKKQKLVTAPRADDRRLQMMLSDTQLVDQ